MHVSVSGANFLHTPTPQEYMNTLHNGMDRTGIYSDSIVSIPFRKEMSFLLFRVLINVAAPLLAIASSSSSICKYKGMIRSFVKPYVYGSISFQQTSFLHLYTPSRMPCSSAGAIALHCPGLTLRVLSSWTQRGLRLRTSGMSRSSTSRCCLQAIAARTRVRTARAKPLRTSS